MKEYYRVVELDPRLIAQFREAVITSSGFWSNGLWTPGCALAHPRIFEYLIRLILRKENVTPVNANAGAPFPPLDPVTLERCLRYLIPPIRTAEDTASHARSATVDAAAGHGTTAVVDHLRSLDPALAEMMARFENMKGE